MMRYAIVTALGCYGRPDTYVHGVYQTLAAARRRARDNPRLSIVAVCEDEDYMVAGYRFPLTRDMLISKTSSEVTP